jgi:hypothetical protein
MIAPPSPPRPCQRPDWLALTATPEWAICCPECGQENSHIREAYSLIGRDPGEAGPPYQGTVAKGPTGERRNALAIVFDGECGHAWRLIFQQHKGTDYVYVEPVEPLPIEGLI